VHWETTPTGHRCTRHSREFSRGHACPGCVEEPDAVDDDGVVVSAQAKRLFVKAARMGERAGAWHELALKAVTDEQLGHAVKLGTLALQYERLSEELIREAEGIEHEADLIRHDREMAGLVGAH
jgi:hypothetical protein